MAPNDESEKLDPDSIENLEQVKKGKPRKFVMICKGTSIVSLVVYKKGSVDKYKKQAKESGKGQIYCGVVDGRGMNINFKLPTSEATKEPVKTLVLRTFLEECADFKCKPIFEIVPELGLVLDEDDPTVARFLKLQQAALEACDAHPGRAGEINSLCLAIGKNFDQDKPEDAANLLATLEKLLNELSGAPGGGGGGGSGGGTTEKQDLGAGGGSGGDQPPTVNREGEQELVALLARLQPEIDTALKNSACDAGRIKSGLDAVADARKAGNFPTALTAAKQLAEALAEEYQTRLVDVESRLETLLSGSFTERTGDVEKMKTVLQFAKDRAEANRHGGALVALKNLAALLDASAEPGAKKESDVIQEGIVASRKKFVESRWQSVVLDVRAELGKLRTTEELRAADPEADQLVDAIESAVDDFCGDLSDAIMGVQRAGEDNRKPLETALVTIQEYKKLIPANPLIAHLNDAQSELGVKIDVEKLLVSALDEIESQLAS